MNVLIVVPGLLGSELASNNFPAGVVWLSYTQIGLGRLGALRLAPDGTSPQPPDGEFLSAGEPLDDYYGLCIRTLRADQRLQGWEVVGWGYDWRKSAKRTGDQLAETVRGYGRRGDRVTLACHSFGGIVARLAWRDLGTTGEQHYVRRVITLGTPHQGSYGLVRLWSFDLDQLRTLSWFTTLVRAALVPQPLPYGPRAWSYSELSQLASSWPAFYETLPLLGGTEQLDDPLRPALYSADWPGNRGVSAALLAYARDDFQALLRDPATMPPADVLTTVAGEGYGTADVLLYPALLGKREAYAASGRGDGLVSRTSALVDGSATYTLFAAHPDLPAQTATGGQLAAWVLDERAPAPIPPRVTVRAGASRQVRFGPPIPAGPAPYSDP